MADQQTPPSDSTTTVPTTTPAGATRARTPQDQLRILALADTLTGEELGAMLRREGVHAAEFETWRSAVVAALLGRAPAPAPAVSGAERKRIEAATRCPIAQGEASSGPPRLNVRPRPSCSDSAGRPQNGSA